jgi:hypothetical protein
MRVESKHSKHVTQWRFWCQRASPVRLPGVSYIELFLPRLLCPAQPRSLHPSHVLQLLSHHDVASIKIMRPLCPLKHKHNTLVDLFFGSHATFQGSDSADCAMSAADVVTLSMSHFADFEVRLTMCSFLHSCVIREHHHEIVT